MSVSARSVVTNERVFLAGRAYADDRVPSAIRKGASVNRVFDGLIVATDENGATVLTIDVLDTTEYEIVIDPVWSGAAGYVSAVRSSPAWRRGP